MTPSQEAREYPPQTRYARTTGGMEEDPNGEWVHYVDADRKARQQEALDAESVARWWLADHAQGAEPVRVSFPLLCDDKELAAIDIILKVLDDMVPTERREGVVRYLTSRVTPSTVKA